MIAVSPSDLEFSDAWVDGDDSARWRSATATGPGAGTSESGASVLDIDPGCRLPRHTDSAEETIVVLAGRAEVVVGGEATVVPTGGLAVVPECAAHEVRNAGGETLRFAALYASSDVTTTYEQPIEPGGERERTPVA